MPKLDATHIAERLRSRLADLEAGAEVAAKEIRALLTPDQIAAMDTAWAEQQQLRKIKRAKNEEERQQLGWKTKRQIQIAVFQQAIADSNKNMHAELQKMQDQAEIRQARIYFDALGKALDQDRTPEQARTMANNALTRAALGRMDGANVGTKQLTPSEKRLRKIEEEIKLLSHKDMTKDELEKVKLLEAYAKWERKFGN
jgi:hypothetical protein